MKLSQLFEQMQEPFVVSMLRKLLDKKEPTYLLHFHSGGLEASLIIEMEYIPATRNVGGALRLNLLSISNDGLARSRKLDLVHSVPPNGAAEFDERWTITKIDGHRMLVIRDKVEMARNLADEIQFSYKMVK